MIISGLEEGSTVYSNSFKLEILKELDGHYYAPLHILDKENSYNPLGVFLKESDFHIFKTETLFHDYLKENTNNDYIIFVNSDYEFRNNMTSECLNDYFTDIEKEYLLKEIDGIKIGDNSIHVQNSYYILKNKTLNSLLILLFKNLLIMDAITLKKRRARVNGSFIPRIYDCLYEELGGKIVSIQDSLDLHITSMDYGEDLNYKDSITENILNKFLTLNTRRYRVSPKAPNVFYYTGPIHSSDFSKWKKEDCEKLFIKNHDLEEKYFKNLNMLSYGEPNRRKWIGFHYEIHNTLNIGFFLISKIITQQVINSIPELQEFYNTALSSERYHRKIDDISKFYKCKSEECIHSDSYNDFLLHPLIFKSIITSPDNNFEQNSISADYSYLKELLLINNPSFNNNSYEERVSIMDGIEKRVQNIFSLEEITNRSISRFTEEYMSILEIMESYLSPSLDESSEIAYRKMLNKKNNKNLETFISQQSSVPLILLPDNIHDLYANPYFKNQEYHGTIFISSRNRYRYALLNKTNSINAYNKILEQLD